MKLVLEYVWIGGNQELHSKTRILETETEQLTIKDIPLWNYDGSSTNQAEINNSDVILSPVTLFRDPFRNNKNAFLVMCQTQRNNGTVLENSHRAWANNIFNKDLSQEPWFGIEQEYFFIDIKTNMPVGYKENTLEGKNKVHYCGVGAGNMSFNILKKINLKDKEYIANDINLENLRKLKNNYQKFLPRQKQLICCQFDKIPLKKNTVDLVLSIGSLHHDRKPLFSLNKICSFLKKNGEIILWVYKTPPLIRVLTDNYFRNKIQQEKKFNKVKDLLLDLTKLGYFLKKNNSDIYINENLKSLEIKKGKFKMKAILSQLLNTLPVGMKGHK